MVRIRILLRADAGADRTSGAFQFEGHTGPSERLPEGSLFCAWAGLLIVAGAGIAGPSTSAAPMGTAPQPQATLVEQTQGYGYCRRLRRPCEFKHERGEVGEGNCARYRRECGGYRWR